MALIEFLTCATGYAVLSLLSSDKSNKNNNSYATCTKKELKEKKEIEGINKCEKLNIKLKEEYDSYLLLYKNYKILNYAFNFNKLIQNYNANEFKFKEAPTCNDVYLLEYEPIRRKKFNIFKSQKNKNSELMELNSITDNIYNRLNNQKKLLNEMKYKIDLCKYKNEKLDKYNEYIIGEKIKQQKLKKDNKYYNDWKNKYYSGDEKNLEKLFELILNDVTNGKNIGLKNFSCKYSRIIKRVYIYLNVQNKEQIFYYERYKYIKTKDEIRKVNLNQRDQNNLFKTFLVSISVALSSVIANNDEFNSINDIIVNCYENNVCRSSFYIKKDKLINKFNFDIANIPEENVRIYSSVKKPVIPLDSYYINIKTH